MNVGHQRHSAAGDDDKINHWAAWSTGMRNTHETSETCLPVRPVWDTFTGSFWTMGMVGALAGVGWVCVSSCVFLLSVSCVFGNYVSDCPQYFGKNHACSFVFLVTFGVYAVQFYIQQRVWIWIITIDWESLQCEGCTLETKSAYAVLIQMPCLQISSC